MRFIPTSAEKVEALKKAAKRRQRAGQGKHADLLNRVARGAGYEHWHHVLICFKATVAEHVERSLASEIEAIISAAQAQRGKVVVTGPEASQDQPFILFATDDGDAWMLEMTENLAICLCWQGERKPVVVRDLPDRLEIGWDGNYRLSGPFFEVETEVAGVGHRAIAGYPVDQLREVIDELQNVEQRMSSIFSRDETVELSDDIVAQLVGTGWEEERLLEMREFGARYSPARNSLLLPPVSNLPGFGRDDLHIPENV